MRSAVLFLSACSGSAVLVRQASPALDMPLFDSAQKLEELSLSDVFQELRSHVNSSDAGVASMAEGAFGKLEKSESKGALLNYARSASTMASNVTLDLNGAIELVKRRMQGASGASVKELASAGLAALEEAGARKELRRLATSAAAIPCPFRYCPFAIQAGLTFQGPFPLSSAMNGGWLVDVFMVLNGRIPALDGGAPSEEKLCISPRIGASDAYSGRFEKATRSLFVGLASWDSTMDESNKWTWGVAGGPRMALDGFSKIVNFFSAEVSFPVVKRRFDIPKLKFDIDNLKVSYCFSDETECSQTLPDLQFYSMLFGEYTMCI